MRRPVDAARVREFLRALGAEAREDTHLYLTGGTTAVLFGWRATTVDLDIKMVPERDSLFRAIPALKEKLEVNVEIASPADFIPELPGWQERSKFIVREGKIDSFHYDFYSQALSKLQRGHAKDREDVREMVARIWSRPKKCSSTSARSRASCIASPRSTLLPFAAAWKKPSLNPSASFPGAAAGEWRWETWQG